MLVTHHKTRIPRPTINLRQRRNRRRRPRRPHKLLIITPPRRPTITRVHHPPIHRRRRSTTLRTRINRRRTRRILVVPSLANHRKTLVRIKKINPRRLRTLRRRGLLTNKRSRKRILHLIHKPRHRHPRHTPIRRLQHHRPRPKPIRPRNIPRRTTPHPNPPRPIRNILRQRRIARHRRYPRPIQINPHHRRHIRRLPLPLLIPTRLPPPRHNVPPRVIHKMKRQLPPRHIRRSRNKLPRVARIRPLANHPPIRHPRKTRPIRQTVNRREIRLRDPQRISRQRRHRLFAKRRPIIARRPHPPRQIRIIQPRHRTRRRTPIGIRTRQRNRWQLHKPQILRRWSSTRRHRHRTVPRRRIHRREWIRALRVIHRPTKKPVDIIGNRHAHEPVIREWRIQKLLPRRLGPRRRNDRRHDNQRGNPAPPDPPAHNLVGRSEKCSTPDPCSDKSAGRCSPPRDPRSDEAVGKCNECRDAAVATRNERTMGAENRRAHSARLSLHSARRNRPNHITAPFPARRSASSLRHAGDGRR